MYGFQILCEISKGTFEISHKILNPYTAKCAFYCLVFCVWVTISLNCDVISLSETGPSRQPTECPVTSELPRIKLKTWTGQCAPAMGEHSSRLPPLLDSDHPWLCQYTYLLFDLDCAQTQECDLELKTCCLHLAWSCFCLYFCPPAVCLYVCLSICLFVCLFLFFCNCHGPVQN